MSVISPAGIFAEGDFSPDNAPVIAAVSGGGDSLALLFLLRDWLSARGQADRLRAVTVDHALRPAAADEAAYVARLCAEHGIIHRTMRWEGAKPKTGIQAAARIARYHLLAQAADGFVREQQEAGRSAAPTGKNNNAAGRSTAPLSQMARSDTGKNNAAEAAFICTAHTMGDQAETYLMRSARLQDAGRSGSSDRDEHNAEGGAGKAEEVRRAKRNDGEGERIAARGLAGIAPLSLLYRKFWLARPLLGVKRADLRAYLLARGIKWIDDPSNEDPHYERVRIRQNMTAEQMAQCAVAAAEAARARQVLSAVAAQWGRKLNLRAEQLESGAALTLDLTAWKNQAATAPSGTDSAALYLLLSYAAAICGGKAYISARDSRLAQFLPRLNESGKGEKPLRISVSGAVPEKRRNILTVRRECRNFPKMGNAASAGENPLNGAVPVWDAPLYALFAPALPAFGSKPQTDIPTPPAWQNALRQVI